LGSVLRYSEDKVTSYQKSLVESLLKIFEHVEIKVAPSVVFGQNLKRVSLKTFGHDNINVTSSVNFGQNLRDNFIHKVNFKRKKNDPKRKGKRLERSCTNSLPESH
ncbi:hypothetical protein Leryth_021926, partial [Lithospermum erythrorhizon]